MAKNADAVAIYSRKSRFTGKGESVGNQVELCKAYIRTTMGDPYAEHAVVYEDEGFSGGNLNRPGFQRMMQAARGHRFQAVVVYRLDRISRSIGDFSRLIEELGRLGIAFLSIRERFDTASPMGRAMMYIASVFSQLERETIAERIRDNMHELAKTGRWLGGVTPTGYTSQAVQTVTVDGKRKRVCQLKLLPEEAGTVRTIYELYRETGSLSKTEAELLRRHIRTKTGRNFTRFSIKGILQNPVYLIADEDAYRYFAEKGADLCAGPEAFDGVRGILAYNRTHQEKGRATVYLPPQEWIVAVGQHPGILPGKIWVSVQKRLARGRSKSYHSPRRNEALLTGLLWCRCGGRMYPKLSTREAPDGSPAFMYVCKQKQRSRRAACNVKNANGNRLDGAVLEQVRRLCGDKRALLALLEQGKKGFAGGPGAGGEDFEALRREQGELRRRADALVDALADFGSSSAAAHIKARLEALDAQNAALESRMEQLAGDAGALCGAAFDRLCRLLGDFGGCIGEMNVEQKREALRALVQKVVWDGSCAEVVLFGAEDGGAGAPPPLPAKIQGPEGGAPAKTRRREDCK